MWKTWHGYFFSLTLPSVLFQAHHVLAISNNLNKKYYAHTFLWNHPVLLHIWDLLSLVFTHKRNKHTVYSLKVISLKNINIQTFQCSFQDILLMWLIFCKIFVVWYSAPVGFTWEHLILFQKHGFCSRPTIQKSGCTLSCRNMWEAQSHDQPPDGTFGDWQEFLIFLAISWQTPSWFIHCWSRAENVRQSKKLRQWTAHQEILNSKELIVYYWS